MYRFLLLISVSFLGFSIHHVAPEAMTYTVHFDQIKFHNGSALEGYYNFTTLRIAKFNRSTFVFNYEGELSTDYGTDIAFQADIYTSRLNNNQYTKSPARIPKMTCCEAVDKFYKVYAMKELKDYSNLPQFAPDDPSCTFKKGKYYVKNFSVPSSKLPAYLPPGYYRFDITVTDIKADFVIAFVSYIAQVEAVAAIG